MRIVNLQRFRRKFEAKLAQSHKHLHKIMSVTDDVFCDCVRMEVKTASGHLSSTIDGGESHRVAMARLLDFFDLADSMVKYNEVAQQNEEAARGGVADNCAEGDCQ